MREAATLAEIHRAAFATGRAWSAGEIEDLMRNPHVTLHAVPHGFALTRLVAGEAELLTLAGDPAHQRQGIARRLMGDWRDGLKGTAETAFLEVATDNLAAHALYRDLGFAEVARRPGYYARANAADVDAVIMRLALTKG